MQSLQAITKWLHPIVWRVEWHWFTKCREYMIGEKNSYGTYPVIFCDKWRWHRGNHSDISREVNWYDQRVISDG